MRSETWVVKRTTHSYSFSAVKVRLALITIAHSSNDHSEERNEYLLEVVHGAENGICTGSTKIELNSAESFSDLKKVLDYIPSGL